MVFVSKSRENLSNPYSNQKWLSCFLIICAYFLMANSGFASEADIEAASTSGLVMVKDAWDEFKAWGVPALGVTLAGTMIYGFATQAQNMARGAAMGVGAAALMGGGADVFFLSFPLIIVPVLARDYCL